MLGRRFAGSFGRGSTVVTVTRIQSASGTAAGRPSSCVRLSARYRPRAFVSPGVTGVLQGRTRRPLPPAWRRPPPRFGRGARVLPNQSCLGARYYDISCYSVDVYPSALEWASFGFGRSGGRLGFLAAGTALALASQGRGRPGPWFGRGGGFGPFLGGPSGFPRGPRARRGDVRAAALLLLAEGPLNGYEIMQEIEKRSDGVWRPSPGSVYPALAQLEDEGMVRTEEFGDRRSYVLTEAGRAQVDERRGELGAPWEQMAGAVDDDVAALFSEMRRVGMAVGQIAHLGSAQQVAKARRVLAAARRALYSALAADESDE